MPKSAIPQTRQIPNPEYGSIQKVARNSGSPLREIGKLFPGIQKRGFFVAMAEIRKPVVRPALPDAVSLAGGRKVPSLIPARVSERIWLLQTLNYSPQGLICETGRHTARKLSSGNLPDFLRKCPHRGISATTRPVNRPPESPGSAVQESPSHHLRVAVPLVLHAWFWQEAGPVLRRWTC